MKEPWYRNAWTLFALSLLAIGFFVVLAAGTIKGPDLAAYVSALVAIAGIGLLLWQTLRSDSKTSAEAEIRNYTAIYELAHEMHTRVVHETFAARTAARTPRFDDVTIASWNAAFRSIERSSLKEVDRELLSALKYAVMTVGRRLNASSPSPMTADELGLLASHLSQKVLVPIGQSRRLY